MSGEERLTDAFRRGFNKIRGLPEIRRRVTQAEKDSSLYSLLGSYSRADAENNPGIFQIFHEREPDADCFFIFPFSANSMEFPTFLAQLQNLGFDLYAIAAMPHESELISPVHSDIAFLRKMLKGEVSTLRHPSVLRTKVPAMNVLRKGRFHLRFYSHQDQTVVSAHIDPPRFEHINLQQHLKGNIKGDYSRGEQLFTEILDFFKITNIRSVSSV